MSLSANRQPETLDGSADEPLTAGHLFFLLHHLVRQRESALGQELAATGLTLGQWQVLATLGRLNRATMGEVAAFCATDRTTLTRTVDRMVGEGLVQRHRDKDDRRQVLLTLTEKGQVMLEKAQACVTAFNSRITGVLQARDVDHLQTMIRRILEHVIDDRHWVDDLMAFRRLKASEPAG